MCCNSTQEMGKEISKSENQLEALSLNLDSCELITLEMVTAYCHNVSLLKLYLENKVYSNSWIDRVFTLINRFIQLNVLHLHITFINEFETSLNDIIELVKLKSCLKQLTLRHLTICPSITCENLKCLNFPYLNKLCIWEDREIARWALIAFLSSCPNVEYLNLRCRYFDDEALFRVMDNGVLQKLKEIELDVPWENLMSYAGVKRLLSGQSISRCVIPSRYFLLFQRALIELKKTKLVEIVDVCGS
uniref:Uncharacterized protein n=1 Tax=Strigamia maritima TaxID=126957 RepID=T1IJ77_STRMM